MKSVRDEIVAKIETKKVATGKLVDKTDNLSKQRETYVKAIAEHEAKVESLKAMIAQIDNNAGGYVDTADARRSEIAHMEEILARYDKAVKEREKCTETLMRRLDEVPDWYPGMDESLRGGVAKDPEYQKALKRRDYLDGVIESCLPDVKKIFYSRGTVSEHNEAGRKGV